MSPAELLSVLPHRIVVSPEVLCQHVEGQAVLLNLDAERYHSLDDVGTRMWDLLSQDGDVECLIASLMAIYAVDEARLRADVGALAASLAEAGLVTLES